MWTRWARSHVGLLRTAACVAPLLLCLTLYGLNPVVTTLEAALLLVLVEVAAAATGDRLVGILCGLSGALGFTYFLTQPYLDFHIANRQDIELAIALLVIGFVVGELAAWGSRQADVASVRGDYIDGVAAVADLLVTDGSDAGTSEEVARRIQRVLDVDDVRYFPGPPAVDVAVLTRTGTLKVDGRTLDPVHDALPTDRFIAVPVTSGSRGVGYFRISAATRRVRVRTEQLAVVVVLADQYAAHLATPESATVRTDSGNRDQAR